MNKRIAAQESRQPSQPMPMLIHNLDGESLEQAAARQGILTGRYLSIPAVMTEAAWREAARVQQAELLRRQNHE